MTRRRTPLPSLYGICGRKGHGKDTFANLVIDANKGYTKAAFATQLKATCCRVFGFSLEQCNDSTLKEAVISPIEIDRYMSALRNETGLDVQPRGLVATSVRQVLQYVGTDYVRSVQDDYWLCRLDAQISSGRKTLVTDVRFPNEAAFLRERGGKIVRIIRIDADEAVDTHASETSDIDADLVLGVRTGDLSLPKRAAWLLAINRFVNAQGYDWRRIQEALAQRRSGSATLQQAAQVLGFTGKDPYAFHNVEAYYGKTTRTRVSATTRKAHRIIDGVPSKHCSKCDQWLALSSFARSAKQWDNLVAQCRSCRSQDAKARWQARGLTMQGLHARMTVSARMREIDVMLSVDDLQNLWDVQAGRCAYTGLPMTWISGPAMVTVDRLDSAQPYTLDNVALCSYAANMMKQAHSLADFRALIEALWSHRNQWPRPLLQGSLTQHPRG